jgi:septin family protein
MGSPLFLCCSAQDTYEQKRQDHLREMQGKEEQMRQMFVQKVSTESLHGIELWLRQPPYGQSHWLIFRGFRAPPLPRVKLCTCFIEGFYVVFLHCLQVKDKESELKSAEQKLHDEFERLRRQNAEEKRQLDDKKRQLVSCMLLPVLIVTLPHKKGGCHINNDPQLDSNL